MIKMIFIGTVVVINIKNADGFEEFAHLVTPSSCWLSSGSILLLLLIDT